MKTFFPTLHKGTEMNNHLNHHHIAELQAEGFKILESRINDANSFIVVGDPSHHHKGNRRWVELEPRVLRNVSQLYQFIIERI